MWEELGSHASNTATRRPFPGRWDHRVTQNRIPRPGTDVQLLMIGFTRTHPMIWMNIPTSASLYLKRADPRKIVRIHEMFSDREHAHCRPISKMRDGGTVGPPIDAFRSGAMIAYSARASSREADHITWVVEIRERNSRPLTPLTTHAVLKPVVGQSLADYFFNFTTSPRKATPATNAPAPHIYSVRCDMLVFL